MNTTRIEIPAAFFNRSDFAYELITQLRAVQPHFTWAILPDDEPLNMSAIDKFFILCRIPAKTDNRYALFAAVHCSREDYEAAEDKRKWTDEMAAQAISQLP